jgi:hypothetical protein
VLGSDEEVIDPAPTSTLLQSPLSGGSWEAIASFDPVGAFRYTFGEQHAVYDIESDLVLSFQVFDPPLTWAFDTDAAAWTSIPNSHPVTRSVSQDVGTPAYDPISDRVLVFSDQGSTFAVDPDTGVWADLAPGPGPRVRAGGAMVYDTESEVAIVFGGDAGDTDFLTPFSEQTLEDTWTYDPVQNLWREQSPASAPPPRMWHQMVYDSQSDRVVLFGGASGDGWEVIGETASAYPEVRSDTQIYGDTWVFDTDTATWTEMYPPVSPAPRIWAAMWYDPVADLVFLYGGASEVNRWPLPSSTMFGGEELWAYDLEANLWTLYQLDSSNPGLLAGATGVFDIESGVAVVFGGGRYDPETKAKGANAQTWIYRHVE